MNMIENSHLKHFGICTVLIFLVFACTESETQDERASQNVEDLEVLIPEKIREFDHIDTLYYSFIGLDSFASDDGFILSVWGPAFLVKTNREGSEIIAKTVEGRGPGELQDIGTPTTGKDKIYVYDQFQTKIVILDRTDLTLIKEILPDSYQGHRISKVYPTFEGESVFLELSHSRVEIDKKENKLLTRFNSESGVYEETIRIKGKPYAPMSELINGIASSSMMVPFSDNQFIVPVPEKKTILLYDTRTDVIAEINASFDTLRAIEIDLPTEVVSSTEKDSIRAEFEALSANWADVEPYIPEVKAKADAMHYNNNRIWLKSNLSGEGDTWFILNMEGDVINLVQLPGNTYLTHVSEHHLGVRLDDVTFALYENPIGE